MSGTATTPEGRIAELNAKLLALKVRRMADDAEGDKRRQLRDLAVRMDTIARQLGELA